MRPRPMTSKQTSCACSRTSGGGSAAAARSQRIAIVDDRPEEQYLYPEFVLARQMFLKAGIDAVIVDASDLRYEQGRLTGRRQRDRTRLQSTGRLRARTAGTCGAAGPPIGDGAVVLTPNPHNHALFADKRNLTLLSDPAALEAWGLSPKLRSELASVPRTVLVTPDNADALWRLPQEPVLQASLRARQQGRLSRQTR